MSAVASARVFPAVLVVVVVAAVAGACGGDDRPTVQQWRPRWEALAAEAPSAGHQELSGQQCERLLTVARTGRSEVLPAPDEALDGPVRQWVSVAETIGFDCLDHDDLTGALRELEIIGAEVDAGARTLDGPGSR